MRVRPLVRPSCRSSSSTRASCRISRRGSAPPSCTARRRRPDHRGVRIRCAPACGGLSHGRSGRSAANAMATDWTATVIIALVALGGSLYLTAAAMRWLKRRAILDRPGARSLHSAPIPRGGGLALVPTVGLCWIVLAALGVAPPQSAAIAVVALALALLSFIDDLRSLPVILRLLGHVAAVILGISLLPADAPIFQGWLPPLLDRVATAAIWVWFVNLYNFMDGIDGIAGVETASLGIGVTLVATLAVAAGALGFLRWNWQPAKVFLGDSGSVPLGYLLGWLLLLLAGQGLWAAALILPLYYLADATITLVHRALRGERVWQAHRSHFYQRAAQSDGDHGAVSLIVLGGNIALIGLAVASVYAPLAALAGGAIVAAATLMALQRRSRRAPAP